MTDFKTLVDKRWIGIGKSLPFSIYDARQKLLLAQGRVVESERSLQRLLEEGAYYKADDADGGSGADPAELQEGDPVDPLTALSRDYANISHRARCGVKIAPKETGESYLCWVIGVSQSQGERGLLMTAPVGSDKALAPVSKGQVWFCRMSSSTRVLRFRGAIQKVAFDPYPYLHILVPEAIERRLVRQLPRALTSLPATALVPERHFVSVVDLSVAGACIGVDRNLALEVGHALQLVTTIEVLGRQRELRLRAKVAAVYGAADSRHPTIGFYRLTFESLDEHTTFMLHGYVQRQLALECAGIGQALATGVDALR